MNVDSVTTEDILERYLLELSCYLFVKVTSSTACIKVQKPLISPQQPAKSKPRKPRYCTRLQSSCCIYATDDASYYTTILLGFFLMT